MTNTDRAKAFFQAINQKDIDGILAMVDDGYVVYDCARGVKLEGKQGCREELQGWLTAFPDTMVQVQQTIAEGDSVVVEFLARGTHKGAFGRGAEAIPPTGRRGELQMLEILRFRDGKLISLREYYDLMTLMRQMGIEAVPQRQAAKGPELRPH